MATLAFSARLPVIAALLCLQAYPALANTGTELSDDEVLALVFVLVAMAYLLPMIVAFVRGHPNRWLIAVINIVFGGTGLGWLGSLVWAFQAIHRSPTGNHGGESGLNLFVNDVQTVRLEPPLPAPPPSTDIDDLSARLLRLKALQQKGAISAAEYDTLMRGAIYGS